MAKIAFESFDAFHFTIFHSKDELSTLITKVKDVVNENEILTERAKYSGENDDIQTVVRSTKFTATSGPNILFESRISELEAQLAQTNIDYKKVSDENAELKRKRAFGNDSAVDSSCSDAYKKQVENLQRDKTSLEDMVKKLQKQITDMKEHDAHVFSKTQRSRDMAEQANFERTQADIEIRRLKVSSILRFIQKFVKIFKLLLRMNWNDNMNV